MKKIVLSLVIASASLGLASCSTTGSSYSPGYNSNYVYSSGYATPNWGYGSTYGVGLNNNNWYGHRYYGGAYARGWHGAAWHGGRGGWGGGHGGWHGGHGGWHGGHGGWHGGHGGWHGGHGGWHGGRHR